MYSKILVPLDGSKLSENILPYAVPLAKALQVPVELLHVVEPDIIGGFAHPQTGGHQDIVEAEKINKTNYLNGVVRSFSSSC